MRHQHTLRLAGVAGLLSVGVLTISAAPSGATLVCPPGVTDPAYCTNVLPVAITDHATDVGPTFATLLGVSGPDVTGGDTTTYFFQYGESRAYGRKTDSGQVGPRDRRDVSQRAGFLDPCTSYHFRIVSSNSDGYVVGQDKTFTTSFLAPISSVDFRGAIKHGERFTVTANLKTRADVTISLRQHGHNVQRFNEGSRADSVSQRMTAPRKTGTYTVRVVAKLDCGSQTRDNSLTVN